MSIVLDLPLELERELAEEAKQMNLPLSEYAVRVLAMGRVKNARSRLKTGAELISYWQAEGIIGSRSDIPNSQEQARHLRRKAETRTHSK